MNVTYRPVSSVLGISPHGILAMVGIVVGAWLLFRQLRRWGLPTGSIQPAFEVGVPAGIVGARADYVLSHPGQFHSIGQVLAVWQGGLALFGGLIAGVGAAVLVLHRRGAPVLAILDATAPSLALAITIGRIGDLLLTDHLGRPVIGRFALGYLVKPGYHLAPGFGPSPAVPPGPGESCAAAGRFYAGCAYHLSAGYDLIGAAVLAALLLLLSRRRLPAGLPIAVFGAWYGTQRLLLDFTRGIDERAAGLTGTQWLAIGVIAAAAAALLGIARRARAGRPRCRRCSARSPSPVRAPGSTAGPDEITDRRTARGRQGKPVHPGAPAPVPPGVS